jgi:hypothetical protein
MTKSLTELNDYPPWIATLTDEQRHEWYLVAKDRLNEMTSPGDAVRKQNLAAAILTYEQNRLK